MYQGTTRLAVTFLSSVARSEVEADFAVGSLRLSSCFVLLGRGTFHDGVEGGRANKLRHSIG